MVAVLYFIELLRDGFGEERYFKVILAETSALPTTNTDDLNPQAQLPSASMEKDERLVGYALYFFNYSTWQGCVLFLEDLFIRAEYRSKLCIHQYVGMLLNCA